MLPKDEYGMPVLPEFAELNTDVNLRRYMNSGSSSPDSNNNAAKDFDVVTRGIYDTFMDSPKINEAGFKNDDINFTTYPLVTQFQLPLSVTTTAAQQHQYQLQVARQKIVEYIHPERKERLEEFISAFLDFSVFDLADVWVPLTSEVDGSVTVHNVFAASSNETNVSSSVTEFKNVSRVTVIQRWSGAVGRAQSSGNPVWSTNPVRLFRMKLLTLFYVYIYLLTLPIFPS